MHLSLPAIVAIATLAPTFLLAAQGPAVPRWAGSVDSLMLAEMSRAGIPGAQVAVVENGRLVYTRGYGVANVETGRPVTERTLFQTGSVPKAVTGAVLAQLAAEGALDLDAPIARYVTELAGRRVGALTSRQLLAHSSGLRDHASPYGRSDDAAAGELFRSMADPLIAWEPDRIYSYSNIGYSLAGYVAERVARLPYADLAERKVLRPLKMMRATYRPLVAMTHDFSVGHGGPVGAPTVLRPTPGNSAEYGAGFLYASAAELARFEMALMAGGMLEGERVLSADAVRAMTTGVIRIPDAARNWAGLGLQVDTVGGERVWRKSGSVAGFASEIAMWPDRQLGVVVSVNRNTLLPVQANVAIARLVANISTAPNPLLVTPAGARATRAERAALLGRYQTAGGNVAEVVEGSAGLEWHVRQQVLAVELIGNRFRLAATGDAGPWGIVLRDSAGRVTWLHLGSRAFRKLPE